MPLDDAVIRFVVGAINRERQRIAKHLTLAGVDERIVQGILDRSEDPNVFRDNGPAVGLDDPCTVRDLPK
jgi:hypothetical protein